MLIGTFQFQNPSKNIIKMEDIDIFGEAAQHYLQQFAKRLAVHKHCVSFACISVALLCTVLQIGTSGAPVTH